MLAIRALLHRDKLILVEKTDSDRGRVKSYKRICKGNDTGCGLYRLHGCIMAILPLRRCFIKLWPAKASTG